MTIAPTRDLRRPRTVGRSLRNLGQHWALLTLCTAFFAVYTATALLRHRQFGTAGYDLGIFDQAVRRYAHFQAPIVPLKGPGYNIFGDHFHPIIALGAPFYWIWDNPQTLLILQAALISLSIPVVYRFARRRTTPAASLAICFGYAASWAFQTMVNFDFHEVAWGVPILALAIDALDRKADRALLLWCGMLLLVREDMGILVLIIGLLRLAQGRDGRALLRWRGWRDGRAWRSRLTGRGWWPGLVLVVAGVAMYELATAVILPHFSPNGQFAYWQYGPTLGPDLKSAVLNSLKRPWHVIDLFFTPWVKTRTLLLLVVPLALLPFRSRYSWIALPLLAQRFFEPAERYRLWQPAYHYNALPWVILVLAMVDGAGRLGLFTRPRLRAALCVFLVLAPVVITAGDRNVAVLNDLFRGRLFTLTTEMKAQQATVDQIPADVCVEADDRLAGHLTDRDYVSIPGMLGWRADLIALDLSQSSVGGNDGEPPGTIYAEALAHGYHVSFTDGPLLILTSPDYAGPSKECGPLGSGKPG
jgi:uncharacterized membrane protein